MATTSTSSFGLIIAKGDGASPEVFTKIAEILDADLFDIKQHTIEVTNQDSPAAGTGLCYAEFISGKIIEAGQVTFDVNFLPANTTHKAWLLAMKNGTSGNYKVTFSNSGATAWGPFAALVVGAKVTGKLKEQLKGTITLQITGDPAWVTS